MSITRGRLEGDRGNPPRASIKGVSDFCGRIFRACQTNRAIVAADG